MVYVLLLLLAVSLIGTTLVRGAITLHRQRQHDETHAQTVRIAEAGWNRAVRALKSDPEYAGEIWKLAEDSFGPDQTAQVTIEVIRDSVPQRLHVTAEFPVGSPSLTRMTLQDTLLD